MDDGSGRTTLSLMMDMLCFFDKNIVNRNINDILATSSTSIDDPQSCHEFGVDSVASPEAVLTHSSLPRKSIHNGHVSDTVFLISFLTIMIF